MENRSLLCCRLAKLPTGLRLPAAALLSAILQASCTSTSDGTTPMGSSDPSATDVTGLPGSQGSLGPGTGTDGPGNPEGTGPSNSVPGVGTAPDGPSTNPPIDNMGGGPGLPNGGVGGGNPAVPNAPTDPAIWINERGAVASGSNPFGIVGDWYAFGDGVTSTDSGNPYRDGMYCVTGDAPGDGDFASHWGAGIGLDLNGVGGEKLPYEYEGKLEGFRMKLIGTVPAPARVHFVTKLDDGTAPFITATLDESVVYALADAQVPLDWGVDNAGERVDGGVIYAIQIQVPGAEELGPIDLCIAEFEPIIDVGAEPGEDGGAFINPDGFALADGNDFGIQGPVYAIGDGVSTDQSGNPYSDGKYCVAGEFSGSADDWGAGIAFDLNRPPGNGGPEAYAHQGQVEGFRIGLSGTSPGDVRVHFVVSEPPSGDQPMLTARLNTTTVYRIDWAQVPASWEVDNAGQSVGDELYTVQVYLDGSEPGPFNVCVEEFTPLSEAQLAVEAEPSADGYNGSRTVDASVLADEYSYWKEKRFRDCGDGTACVPREDGDCISEGVAYGMLLAVGNDDRDAFDKLWAYFEKHKNGNGVMSWQTTTCGAATSQGSATDGELDAAMALIQASCQWGDSYEAEARELIDAIRTHEVTTCNDQTVLKPGDDFGGCDRLNPSYYAFGYFRVFEALTGDATWGNLLNDGYALLASLQPKMNGLVPDWTDSSATVPGGDDGEYSFDASRTPWRVATDYVWFGEERAATFLDGVSSYADSNGGIARLFTPNSAFRGGLAMSGLHQDPAKAQMYADAWLTSVNLADDDSYYPGTLRPIYMLLAANQFPSGCN